jgi:hypothetical protein
LISKLSQSLLFFLRPKNPSLPPSSIVGHLKVLLNLTRVTLSHLTYQWIEIAERFPNHHPGEPSPKLYLKNIAKTVSSSMLLDLFLPFSTR